MVSGFREFHIHLISSVVKLVHAGVTEQVTAYRLVVIDSGFVVPSQQIMDDCIGVVRPEYSQILQAFNVGWAFPAFHAVHIELFSLGTDQTIGFHRLVHVPEDPFVVVNGNLGILHVGTADTSDSLSQLSGGVHVPALRVIGKTNSHVNFNLITGQCGGNRLDAFLLCDLSVRFQIMNMTDVEDAFFLILIGLGRVYQVRGRLHIDEIDIHLISIGKTAHILRYNTLRDVELHVLAGTERSVTGDNGCTIAVIGSGLSSIYPRENVPLAMRIVEQGGAVISEFPMRYQADRRSFPMRNRIISGIATGTIVVEAGIKSGSLITAAQALDQNRTVFAVPGPADSYSSKGCNALIRDGAVLIESFQDVIDEFSGLPGLKEHGTAPEMTPPAVEKKITLYGLELKLWNLIKAGETDIDALIDKADEEASCVSAALLTLELKRMIRQMPGRQIKVLIATS